MVEWQKTCLGVRYLGFNILLVQGLVCLLLVYALILGGGNILADGCKAIGFYNYCFQDSTINDDDDDGCHCVARIPESHPGILSFALIVSLILTYSSLVIIIFGFLTLVLAQYLEDYALHHFYLDLNIFSLIGLFLGVTSQLLLTWDQFDFSHVSPGFLALLMATGGLSLQCRLIRHYIRLKSVVHA